MTFQKIRSVALSFFLCITGGIFVSSTASLTAQWKQETDAKIEQLRKRNCVITAMNAQSQPVPGVTVTIKQLNPHFGFGASLCWDSGFVKIGKTEYGDLFKKYFEWATPENELKWYYNDTTGGQPCTTACYDHGDSIVNWCLANDVRVRGHNLFWNERVEFQAYCARPYGPYDPDDSSRDVKALTPDEQTQFIHEMSVRINDLMTRYCGKVKHWDAINEIVHFTTDNDGARVVKVPGLLATWTGKTGNGGAEVFNWIMDTARALDPNVKLCVNEYNIIEQSHQESDYVSMIQKINTGAAANAKIDIIGLEGHFGGMVSRTQSGSYPGYEALINTIATGVDIKNTAMQFWFTEVDWNQAGGTADKMEELLRFAYSREDFGGLLLWIWWGGRLWREDLTSFLVDKEMNETETGARWRSLVKDAWMTKEFTATTDANGKCSFRGFQGDYLVTMTIDGIPVSAVFTLTPGTDTLRWSSPIPSSTMRFKNAMNGNSITVNGKKLCFNHPLSQTEPVFLSIYTLSGRLMMQKPLDLTKEKVISANLPTGCYFYRIGTRSKTYRSQVGLELR
jgi:GH35 family endo-1,4-beta-xylanase